MTLDLSHGLLGIFGCVFAVPLVGGGILGVGAISYDAFLGDRPSLSPLASLCVLVIPLTILAAGLLLVGWRVEMVFDRSEGTATTRQGLFRLRFPGSRRPLSDFRGITIVPVAGLSSVGFSDSTGSSPSDLYPPMVRTIQYVVRLVGVGGPVVLASYPRHDLAREIAEKYAQFLHVGVRELAEGE